MDERALRANLRRGPWQGGDLNDVFRQVDSVQTIPSGAAQDIGETPEAVHFMTAHVRNGDFKAPPPDTASDINDKTNKLPDWRLVQSQGTSITAKAVADSSSASGYVIRFSAAAGDADDLTYLEQITPIATSRDGAFAYAPAMFFLAASSATSTFQYWTDAQYLEADGTEVGASIAGGSNFVTSDKDITLEPGDLGGAVPATATDIRLRVGVKRTATSSDTATVDLCDVYMNRGWDRILLPDRAGGNEPATLTKNSNVTYIGNGVVFAIAPSIALDGATETVTVKGEVYGCRVGRTDTQGINDSTSTSIDFTATDAFDVLAMHTANDDEITIPRAGFWMVGASVEFAADGTGDRMMWIEKNGVDGGGSEIRGTAVSIPAPAVAASLSSSTIVELALNDKLALTVRQTSGGALNVNDARLWAYLVASP